MFLKTLLLIYKYKQTAFNLIKNFDFSYLVLRVNMIVN